MIAPTRRIDAAPHGSHYSHKLFDELWQRAIPLRQAWLDEALSARPADRAAAERHLSAVYARIGRPAPRVVWVDSPRQAEPLVRGFATLDELYRWIHDPLTRGRPPLASDLAMLVHQLKVGLSDGVAHTDPELSPVRRPKGWPKGRPKEDPWPELPPAQALSAGVPPGVVLHQGLRLALDRSVGRGVRRAIRAATADGERAPVCWYGQHDAAWVGYYDVLRALGLADYRPGDAAHLAEWAGLARSCGWWWPGEEVCVVAERPESIVTEPVPRALHGEVRLAGAGVRFRDGWRVGPG